MREEAGINNNDIKNIFLEMMFQGKEAHIGFYFSTELKIFSQELLERFKKNSDQDIESLKFFSEEKYKEVLKNHNKNKILIFNEFFNKK